MLIDVCQEVDATKWTLVLLLCLLLLPQRTDDALRCQKVRATKNYP